MRANYEVPKEAKEVIIKELYTYYKNVEMLQRIQERRQSLLDSTPQHDVTGISSKYKISNPTETKALKLADELSTRAYIRATERIDYINNAMQRLNEDEQDLCNKIFHYKYSRQRLETEGISKDVYYNTRNKIIYLVAIEFGEI